MPNAPGGLFPEEERPQAGRPSTLTVVNLVVTNHDSFKGGNLEQFECVAEDLNIRFHETHIA